MLDTSQTPLNTSAERGRVIMSDAQSIPVGFCQCGCGAKTAQVITRTHRGYKLGDFYRYTTGHHMKARADKTRNCYIPLHDTSRKHGYVYEHTMKAERALGRPLPPGAEVHHVDENRRNNANTNLVICQDVAYHRLLHTRAKIVRAGGNPNTQQLCSWCRTVKDLSQFGRNSYNKRTGRHWACSECLTRYQRERKVKQAAQAAKER